MSDISQRPKTMPLKTLDEFGQALRAVLQTERTITSKQQAISKQALTAPARVDRLLIVHVRTALNLVLDQVRDERKHAIALGTPPRSKGAKQAAG